MEKKSNWEDIAFGVFVVLVCGAIVAFALYMPRIGYFIGQKWEDASAWNCRHYGGTPVATTTHSLGGGPRYECQLPPVKPSE